MCGKNWFVLPISLHYMPAEIRGNRTISISYKIRGSEVQQV